MTVRTVGVPDANQGGTTVIVATLPDPGRVAATASLPTVLSNEDFAALGNITTALGGTLAVSGPLTNAQLTAAGLATSAAQTTGNNSLSTIATNTAGLATATGQTSLLTATQAPANLATAQASVTTTSAQIVAARTGRRSVTIVNEGTTPVRLGPSGVTTSNGFLLPGVAGASLTMTVSAALFGVTASGTAAVSYYELY